MKIIIPFIIGLFVGAIFQSDIPVIKHIDHKTARNSVLGTPEKEKNDIDIDVGIGDLFQIKCTGGEK